MTEKILLVDVEPAVLMGYERLLRKELQVTTVALALQLQPPPTPRRAFPPILCFHRHSRFIPSILKSKSREVEELRSQRPFPEL